jgi:hypothetical protein
MEDIKQDLSGKRDSSKAKTLPKDNPQETAIESACRVRVNELILSQQNELIGLQLTFDQMLRDLEELKKRRKIAKKALKKAKLDKLGKKRIDLIADDLNAIKEDRRLLKAMIKEKTLQTENLERLISLLETLS